MQLSLENFLLSQNYTIGIPYSLISRQDKPKSYLNKSNGLQQKCFTQHNQDTVPTNNMEISLNLLNHRRKHCLSHRFHKKQNTLSWHCNQDYHGNFDFPFKRSKFSFKNRETTHFLCLCLMLYPLAITTTTQTSTAILNYKTTIRARWTNKLDHLYEKNREKRKEQGKSRAMRWDRNPWN